MVVEGNMDMGKVPTAPYRRAASLLMSPGNIAYPIVAAFHRMVHLRLLAGTGEHEICMGGATEVFNICVFRYPLSIPAITACFCSNVSIPAPTTGFCSLFTERAPVT